MTFEMVAKQAQKALPLKLRATMVQLRATIMVVYAAQGARLAAKLAAAIYLRSQLEEDFRQESSAKAAGIMAMAMLPWSLKPLYGLVTDTVPLFGYFRRSYLMASGLLGTCSWLLLAYSPDASWIGLGRPTLTLILLWLTNLATAFSDVVVDAMIARASKTESGAPDLVAGAQLQTLARFSRAGGGLLSSLAGGFLLESFSPQWIFGLTSLPSLAIALLASGLNESRAAPVSAHSIPGELKMQAKRLSAHLATGGLGWPLLWFFCARALPPSYHALLVYYQMDVLALSTSFLGIQSALGWMAMGVGTLVYNSCLKRLQLRRILVYSTFMGILAHSSTLILLGGYHRQFEIPDGVFALSSEVGIPGAFDIGCCPVSSPSLICAYFLP